MWLLVGMVLCAPRTAHAATGGGGLPWEAPLTTLSNSITGPVAYGVSIIGVVGAGGILIFAGGQINEFLRAVLYVVLVTAFIIAAKNTMTAFGWGAGAEITRTEIVTKGVGYGVASGEASRKAENSLARRFETRSNKGRRSREGDHDSKRDCLWNSGRWLFVCQLLGYLFRERGLPDHHFLPAGA